MPPPVSPPPSEPPSPPKLPYPATPPFTPLPDGSDWPIVRSARLYLVFPVINATGPDAANVNSFERALSGLANCTGTPHCSVHLTEEYASYKIDGQRVISSVEARIDWEGVERTASCPPPPPKLPGEVDLEPHEAECVYETLMHPLTAEKAAAAQGMLSGSIAQTQRTLRLYGMSVGFVLATDKFPTVDLRFGDTRVIVPPSPPPSPSEPPPPPTPPLPPSPPPGLCNNECNKGGGSIGVCEDGGPYSASGTAGSVCDLGTDCDDCREAGAKNGVRMFCFDCPPACQALNEALPAAEDVASRACFDFDYKDGECNAACNSRECDYDGGDCSMAQIQAKCETVLVSQDYTLAPKDTWKKLEAAGLMATDCNYKMPTYTGECAGHAATMDLVPVSLQMNLEPARLLIHSEFNEMMVRLSPSHTHCHHIACHCPACAFPPALRVPLNHGSWPVLPAFCPLRLYSASLSITTRLPLTPPSTLPPRRRPHAAGDARYGVHVAVGR